METKKMNKIIDKLGMVLLIATMLVFNLVIGANEKGLRVVPISIIMPIIVLYLIVFKIKNKGQSIFFKSKVDYFVLIFMLTTILPLIFGTCASYSDTVEFIMKYFFIYSVYILARNVIKEKKQIEIVIITTLIGSLFSVILLFDYNNTQFLKGFIKWANLAYDPNISFTGTFGYANAQAIYMALCIFLAMHRFKVNKNKLLKVLDIIYIIFALYIIWIAESRAVLSLVGIICFILFVVKFRKQIVKHKIKVLIGVFALIIITIMLLSMALKVSKTVSVKDKDMDQLIRYSFKQNQKYTLELELETIYNGDVEEYKDSSFIIKVYDIGKYFVNEKLFSETFGEFNGKYKIEFTPTKDTNCIKIKILNKYKGTIKLDKCYIDGKEHIINYKYLPDGLAAVLLGYKVRGKSIPQRLYMYNDCLKMVKDSLIIGHGGNTWKDMSLAYAEYKGSLKESHSYFFEILISYGIVGVIAYLTLIIYFFIKIFKQCKNDKEKRKEKLLIVVGLMLLILHSMIDFNMSFMLIQLVVYVCIAMLIYDEQELEISRIKKYNIFDFSIMIFLVFISSLYIRSNISKYLLKNNIEKYNVTPYNKTYYNNMIKDDIKNNKNYIEILNEFQDYMKKEPYYSQNENYERYFKLIYQNINNLTESELQKYLEFGIERIKTVKEKSPMYINSVIQRATVLKNIIQNFEKYISQQERIGENIINTKKDILNNAITELKNIVNSEYDTNISNIDNEEISDYDENTRKDLKKKYQNIVESIR